MVYWSIVLLEVEGGGRRGLVVNVDSIRRKSRTGRVELRREGGELEEEKMIMLKRGYYGMCLMMDRCRNTTGVVEAVVLIIV